MVVIRSKHFLLILSWCRVRVGIYLFHPPFPVTPSQHRWPLPVPVPCYQQWSCSSPAHSDPGVITPTLFFSPSSLSPHLAQSVADSFSPQGFAKTSAGFWHGVWMWLVALQAEYCRVCEIGIVHGSSSLQKNMFEQGEILSLAISCRENCLGFWVIARQLWIFHLFSVSLLKQYCDFSKWRSFYCILSFTNILNFPPIPINRSLCQEYASEDVEKWVGSHSLALREQVQWNDISTFLPR